MKSFKKFQKEQDKLKVMPHYGSVGIVFEYDNKILLVKPSNNMDGWSYPKGHTEQGETESQTAIREVGEETGVQLPKNFLNKSELKELDPIVKFRGVKHYWYFNYKLSSEEFNAYFNNSFILPQEQLQIDEVEQARFVDKKTAKKLLSKKFLGILQ